MDIIKKGNISNNNKGQIKYEERVKIEVLLKTNHTKTKIAEILERPSSTIYDEINRNSVNGEYIAEKAKVKAYQRRYWVEKERSKLNNPEIESYVIKKLVSGSSPEVIEGRSKIEKQENEINFTVGKDLIYKWIKKTPIGEKYKKHLRYKGKRRSYHINPNSKKSLIPNRISIDQRPEEVKYMIEFGHHESDTMGKPKDSKYVGAKLIERKTKFNLFGIAYQLRYSMNTWENMIKEFRYKYTEEIFNKIFLSITWDNGVENQKYEILNILSYFCDPYSSWQKPIVEGSFAIQRKYIPKKAKLEDYSKKEIKYINYKMNNTPRACLNYLTPQEAFNIELKRLGVYRPKNIQEKEKLERLEKIYIQMENRLRFKMENDMKNKGKIIGV